MNCISLFKALRKPNDVRDTDPVQVVNWIRTSDKLKDLVSQVRSATSKDDRDKIKKTLPGVTWSGTFSERKKDCLKAYSGLVCLDFDHVTDPATVRGMLAKSPSIFTAFLSPSGQGVKAVVRVGTPADEHSNAEQVIARYFENQVGHPADPQGLGIVRFCFLSHDPDAYLNPDAVPFDLLQDTSRVADPNTREPPPNLPLPTITDRGDVTQKHRSPEAQEAQEAQETHVVLSHSLWVDMDLVWVDTHLPTAIHQTNARLFALARDVLAQEQRHDRTFTTDETRAVFDRWFSSSRPEFLSHSREEYFGEFLVVRSYAKKPWGESTLEVAWIASGTRPPPPETQDLGDGPRRLASLCRELATDCHPNPFFLSSHSAGQLLKVSAVTAHRYLRSLVGLGLLMEVEKGSSKDRKATSFHYKGQR